MGLWTYVELLCWIDKRIDVLDFTHSLKSWEDKDYLTLLTFSRVVLHASSKLLAFIYSLLILLEYSKCLHSLRWVSYYDSLSQCHRTYGMQEVFSPTKSKSLVGLVTFGIVPSSLSSLSHICIEQVTSLHPLFAHTFGVLEMFTLLALS